MKYSILLVHSSGMKAKLIVHDKDHKVECADKMAGAALLRAGTLLNEPGGNGEAALMLALTDLDWRSVAMEQRIAMSSEFFFDARNTLLLSKELSGEYQKERPSIEKFSIGRRRDQANRNCAVMLAMTLEAYINEYGTDRLGEDEFQAFERLSPRDKWIVIPKVATGKTFDRGTRNYQAVTRLFQVRDQWVHYKPRKIIATFKPKLHVKLSGKKIEAPDVDTLGKLAGDVLALIAALHKFDDTAPLTDFLA